MWAEFISVFPIVETALCITPDCTPLRCLILLVFTFIQADGMADTINKGDGIDGVFIDGFRGNVGAGGQGKCCALYSTPNINSVPRSTCKR